MSGVVPPFRLARFVESVRAIAPARHRGRRVDRLPDGRTALIFRVIDDGCRGDVCVAGPRTRAMLKVATGSVHAVMLEFKPGHSTPLLGVAAHELTDEMVMLEDLWGRSGRALCHELLDAKGVPEVLERIACAFASRAHLAVETAAARLARRAARFMEEEAVPVESVADRLGITTRHLRRAFVQHIGISPKGFARSIRLQRVLRLAATSGSWASIAADAGYYDQSHLIADFRELVGLTPRAFLKRAGELEAPTLPCPT